jgi:DNA polymerase-3 subunit beta
VPSEDFPTIPKISEGQTFEMSSEILVKGLKSVWYSASVSSIKPELASVYIYRDGEYITFAATDSFRLAEKKVKAPSSAKVGEILIPFKNIADIVRLLESINGQIKVTTSKNLISFNGEGVYLVSRIIDGVFPDYHQIIPKGFMTEVVVLKQDFINALKISNVFSDKFNQIRLVVDPKKKIFEIQTKNSDIGENKTSVSAALTGERIEANFNYKYVADCFQSIDADSLSLQLGGINKPMIVRPVSGDQTFMYMVMPMNR